MNIVRTKHEKARFATVVSLVFLLTIMATGCTTTVYEDAEVKFKRTSFLNQAAVASLEKTKDGIIMKGYVNDQVSGAALIAEAAARGAASGVKP